MYSFFNFFKQFIKCTYMIKGVLIGLIGVILAGAFIISWSENLPIFQAIYFALVTALTIGYGDITPESIMGKITSIFIGMIGMILLGIIIGISTRITIKMMHPEEFT